MAANERYPTFEHDPLDTTIRSIRLISIDPDLSPEGLIQSKIHHTTIDAKYNCLSYRWGSPDMSHTILVNGKRLNVNESLHQFLRAVRTFTYQEPGQSTKCHLRNCLWIDALCIAQAKIHEKNHQVAQMGQIYSKAGKVIMWLGKRRAKGLFRILDSPIERHLKFIVCNEYWKRAWIAQEVLLAEKPVLMVADQLISFPEMAEKYLSWPGPSRRRIWRWQQCLQLRSKIPGRYLSVGVLWAWLSWKEDKDMETSVRPNILDWLCYLQDVESELPQDRIFSVLEMACDGNRIPVDYNVPITNLAYRVLTSSSREVCLCEFGVLWKALKPEHGGGTNLSIPRVYVNWEEGPDSCSYIYARPGARAELIFSYGTRIDDDTTRMRVPIDKLVRAAFSGFVSTCLGLGMTARTPVQIEWLPDLVIKEYHDRWDRPGRSFRE